MNNIEIIEHDGKIYNIDENYIFVKILSASACSGCHAKSFCPVSDLKEKIIQINKKDNNSEYKIGDNIIVYMKKSLGKKAVFLGYILPFIILFLSLMSFIFITNNEGLSGLLSLCLLIPYYLIIYFNRDKLNKTFNFQIKKKI